MRVQLFGERCSGTNFVGTLLCNNTNAELTSVLGAKHRFPISATEPVDLVILCARNPFSWIQSLYQTPWGAWQTYSGLSFDEFIKTPWRSRYDEYDVGTDSDLIGTESTDDWDQRSGKPYDNPLLMREGKYAAWLSLAYRFPVYVANLEAWQSEPSLRLADLRKYGLHVNPIFTPCPFYKGRDDLGHYAPRVYPKLTGEQTEWIRSQLDLKVERKIGYFR